MTVLPLNFTTTLVNFAFSSPVVVIDCTGSYGTNGTYSFGTGTQREISAIVLTAAHQSQKFEQFGNVSTGDIVIHTTETLYFNDPLTVSTDNRQSFILWQGYKFRVTDTGFQSPNANFNTYSATRYQDHGSDQ